MKNIHVIFDSSIISPSPIRIGILSIESISGRGTRFRFVFDEEWLAKYSSIILDPYTMSENYSDKLTFPFIKDSFPDRWGQTLIIRKLSRIVEKEGVRARLTSDLDFLLGVDDFTRKGSIRFCDEAGTFLSDDETSVPPLSRLGEYSEMIADYEKYGANCKWLEDFYSSSSSLGGARPKLNVLDNDGNLWIAKVPSLNDQYDVGGWEEVAAILAQKAGIDVADTMVIKHGNGHHTLLSKRFDREGTNRLHMASLASFTRKESNSASFLDIAEIISRYSAKPDYDLKELYKRLVFSAFINNTDNHLHNHAFLLTRKGFALSPAYDMNSSIHGRDSVLMIDEGIHHFDISSIRETAPYYDLSANDATEIIDKTEEVVSTWKNEAINLGIRKDEISLMRSAFSLRCS